MALYILLCVYNFLTFCSEMYQGERWRLDPKFQSPMEVTPVGHVFLNDFIEVVHPLFGSIHAKVQRFFMKVRFLVYVYIRYLS